MSLHLTPTEMNKVVRCQIKWQKWAAENRCFWTQPVWKFPSAKNKLWPCNVQWLNVDHGDATRSSGASHLPPLSSFQNTLIHFHHWTKFMKGDNILLTVNMSNLTCTVNSHQYRLFKRCPWQHSPDSFIKLHNFVSCCIKRNYLDLWNTVSDKLLIIQTFL